MNPSWARFKLWLYIDDELKPYIYGGLFILFIGLVGYAKGPIPYSPTWTEIYYDVRSEFIGIGLTILFVEVIIISFSIRGRKKRLIFQMGSRDNAISREAVRQLMDRKWLFDGSLGDAELINANLAYTDLKDAVLIGADFTVANLEGADLRKADLSEANLGRANLRFTKMRGAKLDGANLKGAKILSVDFKDSTITTEQLASSKILDGKPSPDGPPYGIGTIMPNGTVINPKNFEENQEEEGPP